MNFKHLLPAIFSILLIGCASVSVKDLQKTTTSEPKNKPTKVYVMDFLVDSAEFNVDREGVELAQFKADTTKILSEQLVERVTKSIAPAERVDKAQLSKIREGWLLTGRFIRLNQGSRALRTIIGLGAGGTKMETEVFVYDLSISKKRPFMRFATTGGSNAEPGVLTSPGPISAGMSLIKQTMRGVTEDARRTSREITASLTEYQFERGWISPEEATKAKKIGETGTIVPLP